LARYGWGEVVIFAATVITIVVDDLLTGVALGVILAAVKLLYTFSRLDTCVETSQGRTTVSLRGSATFVRLPKLAMTLGEIPSDSEVHVNLEHLTYIDHACLDLLKNWTRQHEANGGSVFIDWDGLHKRSQANSENRAGAIPEVAHTNGQEEAEEPEHAERRSA
jgi:MFS superfamily sulfate permease-like transporter